MARKKAEEKPEIKLVDRKMVSIDNVEPNPWNPNVQEAEIFRVLAQSLREEGFGEPVLAREMPNGKYQIVNGEHRYRLAIETGMTEIPVAIVEMTDTQAKLATVRRNRTRGGLDTLKTAAILRDMRKRMTDDDIQFRLGYRPEELTEMMTMLNAPFIPYNAAQKAPSEIFEIEVDAPTAKWLDDTLINIAGKREKRFEGRPARKQRGVTKALNLVRGITDEYANQPIESTGSDIEVSLSEGE